MHIHNLATIASIFYKRAQQTPLSSVEFGAMVFEKPLFGYPYSFVVLGQMLVDMLHKLNTANDPELSVDIDSTTKSIQDLVEIIKIPSSNELLDTANECLSTTRLALSKSDINQKAANLALSWSKAFVNYAQQIVKKFYSNDGSLKSKEELSQEQSSQSQEQPKAAIKQEEGLVTFLERVFKSVKAGNQPTDNDLSYWNKNKNLLLQRLNALNSINKRTPLQEQERLVLSYLKDKL
jgi:hypothetical protein